MTSYNMLDLDLVQLSSGKFLFDFREMLLVYKQSFSIIIAFILSINVSYCDGSVPARLDSSYSDFCSNEFVGFNVNTNADNRQARSPSDLKQRIDTLYVGISHAMKTLTGENGLFAFLNQACLSSPLVIIIDSDLEETGKYTLKRWTNNPSTIHNVVTITSDNQIRVIRNDLNHYSNLITLDQTQDLVIDGKAGRTLIFSPFKTVSTERSVAILISNFTTNCILKNITVLNNQKGLGYGAIQVTSSQCKVSLENILFRSHKNDESDYYSIGIKCQNGSHQLIVKNCEFTQFSASGVFVIGSTAGQTISGNHFYRFYRGSTSINCIFISDGKGHKINGNYFGGSSPYGGSSSVDLLKACYFKAIYLSNTSFSEPVELSNNLLKNVSLILPSRQPITAGYLSCILIVNPSKSTEHEKSVDTSIYLNGNTCQNLILTDASFSGISVQNSVNAFSGTLRNNKFENLTVSLENNLNVYFNCVDITNTNTSLFLIKNNKIAGVEMAAVNQATINSGILMAFIKLTTATATLQILRNSIDSVYLSCISPTGLSFKGLEVDYNGALDIQIAQNSIMDVIGNGVESFGDITGIYLSSVQPALYASDIELINNVIHLGHSNTLFSGNLRGIDLLVSSTDRVDVLHNSASLEGIFSGLTYSDAVMTSKSISALQIKNNLFINHRLTANGCGVIISLLNSYPVGMSLHWSDYNNFWSSGIPLFKVGSNQFCGFSNWVCSSLEPDSHSFNLDIDFLNDKFLIPDSAYFLPCEPLEEAATDYNSYIRSVAPYKSDIGAFEKRAKHIVRWLGKSEEWVDENNWDIGSVPSNSNKVQIPPWAISFPDIPAGSIVEINNLVNYQLTPLNIDPTSGLTVLGTTCSDTTLTQVVLQGNSETQASLITNNQLRIGLRKPLEGYSSLPPLQQSIHGWHLFSCPVNDYTFSSFLESGQNADLYCWSEANSCWINYKLEGGLINPTFGERFVAGTGYLIASENERWISGNGLSPVTDFNFSNLTLTEGNESTGWHLLGNPFPSGVIWGTDDWSLLGVDNVAKVWSEEDASYVDILPNQGIIPSMNGFFIHINDPINQLRIPVSARIHNHSFYKSHTGEYYITIEVTDTLLQTKQRLNLWLEDSIFSKPKLQSLAMKGYAPSLFFVDNKREFSTITSHCLDTLISLVYNPINQNAIQLLFQSNLPPGLTADFYDLTNSIHYVLKDSLKISLSTADNLPDYYFNLKLSPHASITNLNQIDIYSYGESFFIKNAQDGIVEVYDLAGRLIIHEETKEGLLWKSKPTGLEGLYVVIARSNFTTSCKVLWLNTK